MKAGCCIHLVHALSVRQETGAHISEVLALLRGTYTKVTGKQLTVRYVMSDADKDQRKALDDVLGVDNELVTLMCYFHVAAQVYKRTRGIPITLAARVARDVADMHYTTSTTEFNNVKCRCLFEWQQLPQLCEFASYFSVMWLAFRSIVGRRSIHHADSLLRIIRWSSSTVRLSETTLFGLV